MGLSVSGMTEFLSAHSDWALWISLAFALVENTAIISVVIPSTAILVGVGALVATGALSFVPIFVGAAIGAVIGSSFSWWLGMTYGDRMLRLWPMRDHPEMIEQGRAAFARWGPFAIILGHFVGPLRPVAFLMCGLARMPFWRFQVFNVVGSVGWAFLIPKLGEVGGSVAGWLWTTLTGA